MNYNNTQEAYLRPVITIGVRQQLRARDARDLLGGLVLKNVGKVALLLLALVLVMNLVLSSAISGVDRSIAAVDDRRHALMDENIGLLATRARLLAPDTIERLAAEKLALFAASDNQVEKIN